MIYRPHFTYIAAATPEQTQAREAAANEEWRKRLLMSHTPPSPIIKLNDLAIHIGPEPRIAQTGLPPKVNVEGRNEQSSTVREPTPEPTPSGLHIGPLPRIAQTGLPPKVGGEQEPSPVNQEPIWRYVHGTPAPPPKDLNEVKFRVGRIPTRNEGEPQPIVHHGTPAPPPKTPPPPKPEPLPTREKGGEQENLVQDVLSVLNRTPIVTSPGVRVEPQPIVRPIENPPRSEPGSIPPWLRIEPLPIVEPPVYITPSNVNPPTPKPTPEPNPPGLRTEPLPTMLTPVFSASSVSPSRSPMGPPPMLPMTMPFGGGKEIGGMAADMIYL